MNPSITFSLLCALLSEVAALTCYQCATDPCTKTETCSTGLCASQTVTTYSEAKNEVKNSKSCLSSSLCVSGSLNFGFRRTIISTECCHEDNCNSHAPVFNTNSSANGKTCFTCKGYDCTKHLACVGNEDRCITAKDEVDGQTIELAGCASSSLCVGDFSEQVGAVAVALTCCEGDLCNSGQSVGQSVLLLLGSLVSVLVFH
ncbi:phospholipase A2 inhibitor and Ly6/PLAUR domain-containing protein-like [Alosa sapidissima]|uniref:phospholipase A2 inhibitor and Ly6/PLAUR domain-containing protein-like n=1 Tax=Alosa sapidissima TaxID=34773 RepID=UPI001C086F76|nr:phospholipase A2 inhibitor and Ly6/PLAUR domain-containing protein-like [Alosa sapidissima]